MTPTRLGCAAIALLLALRFTGAGAHPFGNTTLNRQAAIVVHADRVQLRYILDFAEVSTLLARGEADADGDGDTGEAEWQAWARQRAGAVAGRLYLALQGRQVALRLRSAQWRLAPGEAGLEILRLTFDYDVPVMARNTTRIDYRDGFEPARPGWKEVFAAAGGSVRLLRSDVPEVDRSAGLTRFEGEPPQTLAAAITFEPVPPAPATPKPRPAHHRPAPTPTAR